MCGRVSFLICQVDGRRVGVWNFVDASDGGCCLVDRQPERDSRVFLTQAKGDHSLEEGCRRVCWKEGLGIAGIAT